MVKNPPQILSLGREISWTEEPGGYSPRGCKESDMTEGLNNSNNNNLGSVRNLLFRTKDQTIRCVFLRPRQSFPHTNTASTLQTNS